MSPDPDPTHPETAPEVAEASRQAAAEATETAATVATEAALQAAAESSHDEVRKKAMGITPPQRSHIPEAAWSPVAPNGALNLDPRPVAAPLASLSTPLPLTDQLIDAQRVADRLGLSTLSPSSTAEGAASQKELLALAVLTSELTHQRFIHTLERILQGMSDIQSTLDLMTQELSQIESDLTTATSDIEAEYQALVTELQNLPPNTPAAQVDTSRLQAAIDALKGGVGKLSADDAAWKQQPNPSPAPGPAPTPTPGPTPGPAPGPQPAPSSGPVYDPANGLPLLVFVGSGTPEAGYTASNAHDAADPNNTLYTFDQDTANQPTTSTSPDFEAFTGTLASSSKASPTGPTPSGTGGEGNPGNTPLGTSSYDTTPRAAPDSDASGQDVSQVAQQTAAQAPHGDPASTDPVSSSGTANPADAASRSETLGERVHDVVDEVLHHDRPGRRTT